MSTLIQTVNLKTKKVKIFNCMFCPNIDNIWTNSNKTISCCRSCMGNHPIVSRVLNNIKLYANKETK